jgi:hypothetical protein
MLEHLPASGLVLDAATSCFFEGDALLLEPFLEAAEFFKALLGFLNAGVQLLARGGATARFGRHSGGWRWGVGSAPARLELSVHEIGLVELTGHGAGL